VHLTNIGFASSSVQSRSTTDWYCGHRQSRSKIQCWSDACRSLRSIRRRFPSTASSFDGRINYTTDFAIEALSDRDKVSTAIAPPRVFPRKIAASTVRQDSCFRPTGFLNFEQAGAASTSCRRLFRLRRILSAYDCQSVVGRDTRSLSCENCCAERGFHSAKMSPCSSRRAPAPAASLRFCARGIR